MPNQCELAAKHPVFIVRISVSRTIGLPQQNSLDNLLHFSAKLSPDQGIKMLDEIAGVVNRYQLGATAPIPEGGSSALGTLGKDHQLSFRDGEPGNAIR